MDAMMKEKLEGRISPYVQCSTAQAGAFIRSSIFNDVSTKHISINYPDYNKLIKEHYLETPSSLFEPSDDIENK